MNNNYFNFDGKIPEPISKKELTNLFKLVKEGSAEAREKIILHNIRLVVYEINKKFMDFNYDKDDLFSIGIIGLIKAVDSYDMTKGYEFSTYAIRCIDNEILMVMRNSKKIINIISLENIVSRNNDDEDGIKIQDQLTDDYNLEEENEKTEIYKIIREVVNNLQNEDKEIIMLYFGFYNDHPYTQKEIANKLNISQSYVSRIIKKGLIYIERLLVKKDIIEKNEGRNKSRKNSQFCAFTI